MSEKVAETVAGSRRKLRKKYLLTHVCNRVAVWESCCLAIFVAVTGILGGCSLSSLSERQGHWTGECVTSGGCALLKPGKESIWAQALVGGCTISLYEIDGRSAISKKGYELSYGNRWDGDYSIPIPPGEHELEFGWCILGGLSTDGSCIIRPINPTVITFQAEPGHTYVAEFEQVGEQCVIFIVDETEGKRVLGDLETSAN